MAWHSVLGHESVLEQFRSLVQQKRLAHAYLFVGPEGIGKRLFAVTLSQALLCENRQDDSFTPCQSCPGCRQVAVETHPDFFMVRKPKDKHELPVELFIGRREQRGREGLCYQLAIKASRGTHKIAIIDDADYLSHESSNALLKTLEEPPPGSLMILIGTHPQLQLATIRSRCSIVYFSPLNQKHIATLLRQHHGVDDSDQAALFAALGEGSVEQAIAFTDENIRSFRKTLLETLPLITNVGKNPEQGLQTGNKRNHETTLAALTFARKTLAFVESAGSESVKQHQHARILIRFCIQFYRNTLWNISAGSSQPIMDSLQQNAVSVLSDHMTRAQDILGATDRLIELIERCLEAETHLNRRVHIALTIESLIDDLSTMSP